MGYRQSLFAVTKYLSSITTGMQGPVPYQTMQDESSLSIRQHVQVTVTELLTGRNHTSQTQRIWGQGFLGIRLTPQWW